MLVSNKLIRIISQHTTQRNPPDFSVDFSPPAAFAQKAKELIQTPALFTVAFKEEALLNEALPRITSWWFQPIWKILVKLDHFPK